METTDANDDQESNTDPAQPDDNADDNADGGANVGTGANHNLNAISGFGPGGEGEDSCSHPSDSARRETQAVGVG